MKIWNMLLVIITMLSLWSVCRYQLREAWEMKHERMIITTAISMWESFKVILIDLQQQRQNVKQKTWMQSRKFFPPTSLKHLRRYKLSRMKEWKHYCDIWNLYTSVQSEKDLRVYIHIKVQYIIVYSLNTENVSRCKRQCKKWD